MNKDLGASADADRAVVNGAASVSALRASVPSAYWVSPMCAVMMDEEDARGGLAIRPGARRHYLRPRDWSGWPVIAEYGGEVHIIALVSARRGAFNDLVRDIQVVGKTPVVVCPMGPVMPAIMNKWGWQETIVGEGWDRREEWRPAQAIETRRAETEGLGAKHESAVAKPCAPKPPESPRS